MTKSEPDYNKTCVVCGKTFKKMTLSHIRTHPDVDTWEQYNALVEKAKAEMDGRVERFVEAPKPASDEENARDLCATCGQPVDMSRSANFIEQNGKVFHRRQSCHHAAR